MTVYRGTVFETPARGTLNAIPQALVVVNDSDGLITQVLHPEKDVAEYAKVLAEAERTGSLVGLSENQYIMPGMIDLHVHAPQWPQLGKFLDRSLENWLQECTFPNEAKFEDVTYAKTVYSSLVSTLLANGTTCVAYFGSLHTEASVELAKICIEKGQRAIIGRSAMDKVDQCPEYYRDPSPAESVRRSEEFIQRVRALPHNEAKLVLPAVIPRFIPSCSHEALQGLGELVKKYNCHVQTHCSESNWEHGHVLDRYGKHDAFALDDFGFLTRHTILAHSNFLSDEDMDLVKARGAAVGHCPLSNIYFSNAVFPLHRALDKGVHVGMGTDVAGGPTPSIFDVCRYAVASSRVLEDGVDPRKPSAERTAYKLNEVRINHVDAFYVATTLGGVSVDMKIGRIAPGYFFDALVVDTNAPHSNVVVFKELDSLEDVFQKIVYGLTPANIKKTFVAGRLVHSA